MPTLRQLPARVVYAKAGLDGKVFIIRTSSFLIPSQTILLVRHRCFSNYQGPASLFVAISCVNHRRNLELARND